MRDRIVFLAAVSLFALGFPGLAQEEKTERPPVVVAAKTDDGYDEAAARNFGADEHGMRKYVVAFLKRGPNRPTDPAKAAELQAAHLKNIGRLAAEGKLVLAGPFLDGGELRGIFVFAATSLSEAEELVRTDPAVQAGSLTMELKEWYGSAALMAVNAIHRRICREPAGGGK